MNSQSGQWPAVDSRQTHLGEDHGMRHLVNAYEVEAGTVQFAGNTVICTWAPWV